MLWQQLRAKLPKSEQGTETSRSDRSSPFQLSNPHVPVCKCYRRKLRLLWDRLCTCKASLQQNIRISIHFLHSIKTCDAGSFSGAQGCLIVCALFGTKSAMDWFLRFWQFRICRKKNENWTFTGQDIKTLIRRLPATGTTGLPQSLALGTNSLPLAEECEHLVAQKANVLTLSWRLCTQSVMAN